MVNALENVIHQDGLHEHIELETYVSPNFMGLFVKDINAEWLKNIAVCYVNKIASLGITAEPQVKSLHLTLAYQFPSSLFQSLRLMVEKLGPNTSTNWELRLYSRDLRLQNLHVHKVTHAHVPREHDELELRVGDYIYVPEGACNASTDGWVEGISWLTGISGHLPLNHTKRTAESDSWTLHTTVPITDNKCESAEEEEIPKIRRPPPVLSPSDSTDTPDGIPTAEEPVRILYCIQLLQTCRQIYNLLISNRWQLRKHLKHRSEKSLYVGTAREWISLLVLGFHIASSRMAVTYAVT